MDDSIKIMTTVIRNRGKSIKFDVLYKSYSLIIMVNWTALSHKIVILPPCKILSVNITLTFFKLHVSHVVEPVPIVKVFMSYLLAEPLNHIGKERKLIRKRGKLCFYYFVVWYKHS